MSTGPSIDPASPGTVPDHAAADAPARTPRPESKHWLPLIIVVVLALAIVVPPLFNIGRYQHRIAENIGRSIGRPVHFSQISLRLLPRPGFDLTDFTVDEGPGFSPEPILHSASVIASVRLLSLWRGRLEIARIALDEPSLNLVRNAEGSWNFASVVTQASHGTGRTAAQPWSAGSGRFPYIEATNARINFKFGDEKQPFSFMNGDLSLWLAKPDEWQLRFAAQPIRTDVDLFASNTGLVRVEGSIQSAATLGDIPLDLRVEWTHAPLGQIARLAGGEDEGWRADLNVLSHLTGTPSQLFLSSTLKLNDLHRVEFAPQRTLSYAASCSGTFRKATTRIDDLQCLLPLGNGKVTVTGMAGLPSDAGGTQFNVGVAHLPAAVMLDLLRLMRQRLGANLALAGEVNGRLTVASAQGHTSLTGGLTTGHLKMSAPALHAPLELGDLRLFAPGGAPLGKGVRGQPFQGAPFLLLAPVKVDFGSATPLLVDGRFDRRGFLLHFGGRGQLGRLVPAIHALGLLAPGLQSLAPSGEASLDLQLRGPWLAPVEANDFGEDNSREGLGLSATPSGSITLRNASLLTPYLARPLTIRSAQASIAGTPGGAAQIAWSGIVAQYGSVQFEGNFRVPLSCGGSAASVSAIADGAATCIRQFDVTLPALDLGTLATTLSGDAPLMHQLIQGIENRIESTNPAPGWPAFHGTVRIAAVTLGTLTLNNAVASVDVQGTQAGTRVKIDSLDARTLDGMLHLSGTIDAGPSPAYVLDAQLNQASIAAVGQLYRQSWGSGTINVATHVALNGLDRQDLLSSAHGMFHFDWSRGGLHVPPAAGDHAGSPFLRFDQWTADGQVKDGGLAMDQSLLTSPHGASAIQGTIGFDTQLNLKVSPAAEGETGDVATPDAGMLGGSMATPEFTAGP